MAAVESVAVEVTPVEALEGDEQRLPIHVAAIRGSGTFLLCCLTVCRERGRSG